METIGAHLFMECMKNVNPIVKPIYKHLQPVKWYVDLFDKITKEGATHWEEIIRKAAYEPKPERLEEFKQLIIEKDPNITDQEVWDANRALFTIVSLSASLAYTKMKNKQKRKTVNEWRDKDRERDKRIMSTKPLEEIKCPECKQVMEYKFSQLHDRGTVDKPDEVVMFLYECPKKCKRKFVFEDGSPWISKEKNLCPVCQSERSTTVTKDNQNKMYFIYECKKCGSKQVEKEDD